MNCRGRWIIVFAYACIAACVGEFVTIFLFGHFYPGYSQLEDTMSKLGASASPVSAEVSTWWIIMGILMILFGIALQKAFRSRGVKAKMASLLIILYGVGEGLGSGIFKADRFPNELTTSALIHDVLGGIGVLAVLIFPLVMQKLITKTEKPKFHLISKIAFVLGIVTIALFLFRYSYNTDSFLATYTGLWQRLFMLNTYVYFTMVAAIVIRRGKRIPGKKRLSKLFRQPID